MLVDDMVFNPVEIIYIAYRSRERAENVRVNPKNNIYL